MTGARAIGGALDGDGEARPDLSRAPLLELTWGHRLIVRTVLRLGHGRLLTLAGAQHIASACDPYILAANHSTRLEAALLPAWLMALRGGRRVHFLADWNFQLIPGVRLLYDAAQVIVVPNKPAKPALLDVLRPVLTRSVPPPFVAARQALDEGRSIAIFPEGTVNGDRDRLRRGKLGAARLAVATGAPVVPVGLSYPVAPEFGALPEGSPAAVRIGQPMWPGTSETIQAFHIRVMGAIATLSGKLPPTLTGDEDESVCHDAEPARRE